MRGRCGAKFFFFVPRIVEKLSHANTISLSPLLPTRYLKMFFSLAHYSFVVTLGFNGILTPWFQMTGFLLRHLQPKLGGMKRKKPTIRMMCSIASRASTNI